jgi:Xaa-Pro dipeptidase
MRAFPYGEDPARWPEVFRQAVLAAEIDSEPVGVEPRRLRFLELRMLEGAAAQARFISGEEVLADLRQIKDPAEISAMRRAVDIAQRALNAALPVTRPGTSERDLASELILQLYRNGSDPEMPFTPIVSAGPNSANPHAAPTNRLIVPGDLLVIDWGASADGYVSDLTRTFAIGEVAPRLREIARVVKEANEAARLAVRPGVTASAVDRAAREVIERAGYGQFFIHRTGHGLGLEGHEDPYIRSGNEAVLEPGMTFTIEPGIYLPGENGVRIEDNVVVTADGCETLSDLPRDLIPIGG